ncbi:MAG: AEC family transporter [Cardiobacteriaceae bacterium]|nr:AEC family transporter [Cardiobacteriaceae bacterium]
MLNILTVLLPIFLVIATGYGFTRFGGFSREGLMALGRFVIGIALPALVFKTLAERQIADILIPAYLIGYSIAALLCFALGLAFSLWVSRQTLVASAINALGQSFSNSAFVGYPLLLGVLGGGDAGVYFALNTMVENVLLLPLFLVLIEIHQGGEGSLPARILRIVANTLRKPLIVALILGLLFAALEWRLPLPVQKAIDLLAAAAAPIAIFVIGGGLNGIRLQGNVPAIIQITIGKLVLMPALAALFIWLSGGTRDMVFAGALMGGVAMANTVAILAQHHGFPNRGTASMMTTNVLSVLTLSVIFLLQ